MTTDFLKARLSAAIVVAAATSPEDTSDHVRVSQMHLRGWTLHSAFRFVSGKRFLAQLELLDDDQTRADWAFAHVFAKELTSGNNWSGAGRPSEKGHATIASNGRTSHSTARNLTPLRVATWIATYVVLAVTRGVRGVGWGRHRKRILKYVKPKLTRESMDRGSEWIRPWKAQRLDRFTIDFFNY